MNADIRWLYAIRYPHLEDHTELCYLTPFTSEFSTDRTRRLMVRWVIPTDKSKMQLTMFTLNPAV